MLSIIRALLLTVTLLGMAGTALAEPTTAEALIQRHRSEKAPVWNDGDTVTFFHQGEADKVEVTFGGDIRRLERLPDSDVWRLAVKLPDLEHGVFSYRFTLKAKGKTEKASMAPAVWRGPKAPPPAEACTALKGSVQHAEIESKALGTSRDVTVYQAPGCDAKKSCPVIYAADGEEIEPFLRVLEPLITSGRVPPIVVIAVHSGGYKGGWPSLDEYDPQKDLRAQEYFPGLDAKRFSNHEAFFTTEVPAWAEKRFGVSPRSHDRAIFGCSNGGRFAVEMGLRHPGTFGTVFGFSVPGTGEFHFGPETKDLPRFYLTAGTWEKIFHHCTSSLAAKLKERKAGVRFDSRVGGHDMALWRDQFAVATQWAFGKN